MFVFTFSRAHLAVSRHVHSALIFTCLLLVPTIVAPRADQIGVTAALRGAVVRTASLQTDAPIGQMSSGQKVFLGDDIKVGAQGRLQVMLLDETVFTLGSNSVMRIDEFVYDPGQENTARLTTSIKSGAFRFVSGQVARLNNDAMTVKLPAATIGVRGTSVGGEVEEHGTATVILLGPAPNNALGLPPGAISVANDFELLGDLNITSYGVDAYRKLADTVQANANISYVERAYEGTKSSKDGNTTGVSIGFNYLVNPRVTLGVSSNYQIVEADTDPDQDKEVTAGQVSLTTMLANGHIVSLAAIYSDVAHDNNYSGSVGPTSTGKKREDEITTFRLNYSVVGQMISPRLRDVRIQAGYNYSETQSNLTDFTSDTNGFSLTFAYVFNY